MFSYGSSCLISHQAVESLLKPLKGWLNALSLKFKVKATMFYINIPNRNVTGATGETGVPCLLTSDPASSSVVTMAISLTSLN